MGVERLISYLHTLVSEIFLGSFTVSHLILQHAHPVEGVQKQLASGGALCYTWLVTMPRIAIISDIHANFQALCAVLEDALGKERCVCVECLGDIVGYNADPAACLERIRNLKEYYRLSADCFVVKGNHDEGVVHPSMERMNEIAYKAIEWNRSQLNEEQLLWLSRLQYQRIVRPPGSGGAPFTIVHASLDQVKNWNYMFNGNDAVNHFQKQFSPVCFHGHTHVPRVFCWDGRHVSCTDISGELANHGYVELDLQPGLNAGYRFFINVGSVGQPRDRDWRASYGIYDTDLNVVSIKKIPYDLQGAQQAIWEAGLPGELADRLAVGC